MIAAAGVDWARRAARVAAGLVAVVAAGALALALPMSARAATTQAVQFSTDGIHFSDAYTGQLFSGEVLVPNDSSSRSFYVRNAAGSAALLTITLFDVSTDDVALGDAMTISSSTPGFPGAAVAMTLAQPCRTLSDGLRLSAGDSVRVDNTLALGDLSGMVGQSSSLGFRLLVSLRSTDAGAPMPNTCPVDSGDVTGLPDPSNPGSPASGRGSTATTIYHPTASGWTTSSGRGTTVTPTTTAPTTPETPTAPFAQTLVSNTARFYQEYDVAFWLAMSVLGALFVVARRRRAEDQPDEPEQHAQIGTER